MKLEKALDDDAHLGGAEASYALLEDGVGEVCDEVLAYQGGEVE